MSNYSYTKLMFSNRFDIFPRFVIFYCISLKTLNRFSAYQAIWRLNFNLILGIFAQQTSVWLRTINGFGINRTRVWEYRSSNWLRDILICCNIEGYYTPYNHSHMDSIVTLPGIHFISYRYRFRNNCNYQVITAVNTSGKQRIAYLLLYNAIFTSACD